MQWQHSQAARLYLTHVIATPARLGHLGVRLTSNWENDDDERFWRYGVRRWHRHVADTRTGGLGHRCADQVPALVGVALGLVLAGLLVQQITQVLQGSTTEADGWGRLVQRPRRPFVGAHRKKQVA